MCFHSLFYDITYQGKGMAVFIQLSVHSSFLLSAFEDRMLCNFETLLCFSNRTVARQFFCDKTVR